MDLVLYKCADDPRTISKSLSDALTVSCHIKNECSIMQPEFYINNNDTIISGGYNYAAAFGKYYFISDITLTPAQALRIRCREDVLYTYAAQILACPAIVARNSGVPNTYLPDPELPLEQYKNQQVLQFTRFYYYAQTIIVCAG